MTTNDVHGPWSRLATANELRYMAQVDDAEYVSQSARDAQARNYGGPSYWDYLERAAFEKRDHYIRKGDDERANHMMTRSLSESLMGNDGE